MDDLTEENNVLKKEKAELHFQIKELIRDCEVMWKKSLVLRNEHSVGNAEYSFISSNLTATEHYHSNLHTACHSTTQYVKNGLMQLQRFLQKSSDFKENKEDLFDVPDIEFSFSTLRNNDSLSETLNFSNISQINQTFNEDFTINDRVEQFEMAQLKTKINEIESKLKDKCIENKELQSKLSCSKKKDEYYSRHNNPLCLATIDQSLLVDSNDSLHNQYLNNLSNGLKVTQKDSEYSENDLSRQEISQNINDSEISSLLIDLDNTLKDSDSSEEVYLLKKELQLKTQENEELSAKLIEFDNLKQSHDNLVKEIEHLSSESFMNSTLSKLNMSIESNEIQELKCRLKKMDDHLQTKHSQNEELLSDFNSLKEIHEKLLKEIEYLSSDSLLRHDLSKMDVTIEKNNETKLLEKSNCNEDLSKLNYLREENCKLSSLVHDNDFKLTELDKKIREMENELLVKCQENKNLHTQLSEYNSLKDAHEKLVQEIQILSSESFIQPNMDKLDFTLVETDQCNFKVEVKDTSTDICDMTFESEVNSLKNYLVQLQNENHSFVTKLNEFNTMKESFEKLTKQHEQSTVEADKEITELKNIQSEMENDLQLKCQQNTELENKLNIIQQNNRKLQEEIDELSYKLEPSDDDDFKLVELQIALSETQEDLSKKCEESIKLLNKFNDLQNKYDDLVKESLKSNADMEKELLLSQLEKKINDLNKHLEIKHEEINLLKQSIHDLNKNLEEKIDEIEILEQSNNDQLQDLKAFYCEIFAEASAENFNFEILKTHIKSIIEKSLENRSENENLMQRLVEMDKINAEYTAHKEEFEKLSTDLMESIEFGESQKKKLENLVAAGVVTFTELKDISDEDQKYQVFLECIEKAFNADNLKSQISLLEMNIKNIEDEKHNLKQDLIQNKNSLEQAGIKCEELLQIIAELRAKDDENKNGINLLKQQITDLNNNIHSMENTISNSEQEKCELKDKLMETESNIIDLQNKMACQEKLNCEVEDLRNSLQISQQTSVLLEKEHLDLKTTHSQIIHSLNETTNKLKEAQEQLTTLNIKISDLEKKDSANCIEKQELINELKKYETMLDGKKTECQQLKEQLTMLEKINEQLDTDIKNKLKDISLYETQQRVFNDQKNKLCENVTNLGIILQNQQLDTILINNCKEDILRIKDGLEDLDDELKKPFTVNILGILKQMDILNQCKLENETLKEELDKLKLNNDEKNAEIKKLNSINNMLEIRSEDLQSELSLIMKNSPRARRDLQSKRRSIHESFRKVSLSPIPNENEMENHNIVIDELKGKLGELEVNYNNLRMENDKIAKNLDLKIEETVNLIKLNHSLKLNLKLLQKKKQTADAQTNTEAEISPPLMSLFVDKMTHNAEKEKNKQLQNQIEDLRSKNRELSDQVRRLNISYQNNTVQSLLPSNRQNNDESSNMKIQELETILTRKDEQIKELEVKCKELDDECEKCQMVIDENRDGYNSMYEEIENLKKKYAEQKSELEKLKHSSINESMKKKSLPESHRVPLSPKTESTANRENMDSTQNSSISRSAQQCLKFGAQSSEFDSNFDMSMESKDIIAMKKQYTFLQRQIVGLQQKLQMQSDQQMSYGIVQQHRFGEYYTANQKLYAENLKLRKLCHKYATQIKEFPKTSDK